MQAEGRLKNSAGAPKIRSVICPLRNLIASRLVATAQPCVFGTHPFCCAPTGNARRRADGRRATHAPQHLSRPAPTTRPKENRPPWRLPARCCPSAAAATAARAPRSWAKTGVAGRARRTGRPPPTLGRPWTSKGSWPPTSPVRCVRAPRRYACVHRPYARRVVASAAASALPCTRLCLRVRVWWRGGGGVGGGGPRVACARVGARQHRTRARQYRQHTARPGAGTRRRTAHGLGTCA